MAGKILTPSILWADFAINKTPSAVVDKEKKKGEVSISHLRINGRAVKDGNVSIACVLVRNTELKVAPGIILVQDFSEGLDETFATFLATKGYNVLIVDIVGKTENSDFYTVYPQSLSHANYEQVKDSLYSFEGSAKESCWFEWVCATRYALAYFDSLPFVSQIGGMGVGEASTVIWQTAATDKNLTCAVIALNAGWNIYRGYDKFGLKEIPQFSDDVMKVLAGIEPESYAPHVTCPTLTVVALNDERFDSDRSFDTVSRIPEGTMGSLYYSASTEGFIDEKGLSNILIFLKEFLLKGNVLATDMPFGVGIKSEIKDGKIIIDVTPDPQGLKEISLMCAEGETNPALRTWSKTEKYISKKDDTYRFEYIPYHESSSAYFFASVSYRNGFSICSNIICRKFTEKDIKQGYKNTVMFSSRSENAESIFVCKKPLDMKPYWIDIKGKNNVFAKSGTMGIVGAGCNGTMVSYCVNSVKYKPKDDCILMLDVMAKKSTTLTVKLITDYYGDKTEYSVKVSVKGLKAWNNIKIERTSFKSQIGMVLKTYKNVQAIEFSAEEGFLVNNILWV